MFPATVAPGAYYDDYSTNTRYLAGDVVPAVLGIELERGRYWGVFV